MPTSPSASSTPQGTIPINSFISLIKGDIIKIGSTSGMCYFSVSSSVFAEYSHLHPNLLNGVLESLGFKLYNTKWFRNINGLHDFLLEALKSQNDEAFEPIFEYVKIVCSGNKVDENKLYNLQELTKLFKESKKSSEGLPPQPPYNPNFTANSSFTAPPSAPPPPQPATYSTPYTATFCLPPDYTPDSQCTGQALNNMERFLNIVRDHGKPYASSSSNQTANTALVTATASKLVEAFNQHFPTPSLGNPRNNNQNNNPFNIFRPR